MEYSSKMKAASITPRLLVVAAVALLVVAPASCRRKPKGGVTGQLQEGDPSPPASPITDSGNKDGPKMVEQPMVTLRFASFALRDIAPSADEAKAVSQGQAKAQDYVDGWLQSAEHQQRVGRFFNDFFGVDPDVLPAVADFALKKNARSLNHLFNNGACSILNC